MVLIHFTIKTYKVNQENIHKNFIFIVNNADRKYLYLILRTKFIF